MQPIDPTSHDSHPSLGALVSCVGGIIALTEAVRWRLFVLKLVAVADERRFVARATAELEEAANELAVAEEARHGIIERLAGELAVPAAELSLRRIIELAPEGVAAALTEHRHHLELVNAEIEALGADIRRLVGANLEVLANLDDTVRGSAGTYGSDGRSRPGPGRHRVQRAL